jgi:hypothetical protein
MKLQTEWVEFEADGKKVQGYLARPAAAQGALPAWDAWARTLSFFAGQLG